MKATLYAIVLSLMVTCHTEGGTATRAGDESITAAEIDRYCTMMSSPDVCDAMHALHSAYLVEADRLRARRHEEVTRLAEKRDKGGEDALITLKRVHAAGREYRRAMAKLEETLLDDIATVLKGTEEERVMEEIVRERRRRRVLGGTPLRMRLWEPLRVMAERDLLDQESWQSPQVQQYSAELDGLLRRLEGIDEKRAKRSGQMIAAAEIMPDIDEDEVINTLRVEELGLEQLIAERMLGWADRLAMTLPAEKGAADLGEHVRRRAVPEVYARGLDEQLWARVERLDLTEEQRDVLEQTWRELCQEQTEARKDAFAAHWARWVAEIQLSINPPDERGYEEAYAELGRSMKALDVIGERMASAIQQVLSEEQWKKVASQADGAPPR